MPFIIRAYTKINLKVKSSSFLVKLTSENKTKGAFHGNYITRIMDCYRKIIAIKKSKVGIPKKDAKQKLLGILYVLKNGSLWSCLSEKYGCPSTVYGIFQKILKTARSYYFKKHKTSQWYVFDTLSKETAMAKFSGPNPTDRAKQGIKQSILIDKKRSAFIC